MRLLWFNMAMDDADPMLAFAATWVRAMATRVSGIHVITMRTGEVSVPANVRVYSVGKERGFSEPRRVWEFYRDLISVLRTDRIDLAFSHMITPFALLAAPVTKLLRIPLVNWYAHLRPNPQMKVAHHLSDRVVTSLKEAYPYRHDKLAVVGQGIDTALFSPDRTPPMQPPMILCAGRLSPVKNHATLLRAIALVRARWTPPFKVVVAGGPAVSADEAYADEIWDLAHSLGLHDIVEFRPFLPMTALPDLYRACTVYVNMTATGSGDKVAWEAMSCARPAILCNAGFEQTLGRYAPVLLFKHNDAADLADRVVGVLEMPAAERGIIGDYLRTQIIALHSLDGLTDRLLSVFAATAASAAKRRQGNHSVNMEATSRSQGRERREAD